jgi:hypothetical protein
MGATTSSAVYTRVLIAIHKWINASLYPRITVKLVESGGASVLALNGIDGVPSIMSLR